MGWTQSDVEAMYLQAYGEEPFVVVNPTLAVPSTASVVGSNRCLIVPKVFVQSGQIVVFSVLDNLIKGASGQAVQLLNLMCGLHESEGLSGVATYV